MAPKITISNLGIEIEAKPGRTLLNSMLYEEVPIHTVCGGKANCGCCRVRILSDGKGLSPVNPYERERLGEEALQDGWRLACQTVTLRNVTLYLPGKNELASHCTKL